ncbi:cation-transporting P-type ATPase [Sulfurimonas sp. HSL-1656]|uniref:cation-transporting P-type ATPase n=1 Tax=Thiomicrolovo subterrani TaxID=3131934 RepID=UPI0031F8F25D
MENVPNWHAEEADKVLEALETSPDGLSEDEAAARLETYGPNRLPEPPKPHPLLRFLAQFHNILIYVLLGAAFITALLGHLVDTAVILAVVLINALIGFLQEGKAEKALEAIRHMLALHSSVVRSGRRSTVAGETLVPGDIVILGAGDKVPADLRLLKAISLQIQEAILTGESVPVEKRPERVDASAPLGDRICMAYSGTTVTRGQGTGVVIATGGRTEIGRISSLLSEVQTLNTPLVLQMARFAKVLTLFILIVSALILAVGHSLLDHPFDELFMAVVGIFVAAIPEGLPAVLTITLAVGVQAMARRNAIVRRLPAIETLGAVSVICSDKTGTLTRNEMNVATVVTAGRRFTVGGTGYEPAGEIETAGEKIVPDSFPELLELGEAAAVCNDAELLHKEEAWQIEGDPMEGALLAFYGKVGGDLAQTRGRWFRSDAIPFDSAHKFMATLNHDHENRGVIFVKGAPEALLGLCDRQREKDNGTSPLDRGYWLEQAETVASHGQRVLAFALAPVPTEHTVLERSDLEGALIFLGLAGFIDPPRPEAVDAVAECRRAGIGVKMITGDHATTALAIGKALGLEHADAVLTGPELDTLDDAALTKAVTRTGIFARTSPEHKLRLVMALQANGMTVAMTGDGVNDAPALKRAGAGIAMGKNGSEAAKEAAEIVLADDNFASIVAAVREGRTVYDNIKKVISWTLPTNAGEALTIIAALLLQMALPITPVQILWVNMITAVTLGIALAFEPTERHTMRRPPRPRDESLLGGGLLWHIILVAALFLAGVFGIYDYAVTRGDSDALARTLAMNTLVTLEIFHLLFIRNFRETALSWSAVRGTRIVWSAVGVVLLGQLCITYLPALQGIFGTEAVPPTDLLLMLGLGLALFGIIEAEKQLRLRLFA